MVWSTRCPIPPSISLRVTSPPLNLPPPSFPLRPALKPIGDQVKKKYCDRASAEFRSKITSTLLPRLAAFEPDLLFISAGFDGHCDDMYHWLREDDYHWVTKQLTR